MNEIGRKTMEMSLIVETRRPGLSEDQIEVTRKAIRALTDIDLETWYRSLESREEIDDISTK